MVGDFCEDCQSDLSFKLPNILPDICNSMQVYKYALNLYLVQWFKHRRVQSLTGRISDGSHTFTHTHINDIIENDFVSLNFSGKNF